MTEPSYDQRLARIVELFERVVFGRSRDPALPDGPVLWPALTSGEAAREWPELFAWVEQLRVRFPNAVRLPDCWWRHNDLVELLAALRDYERACFGPDAPPTGAVDWHRAFRDIEARLETWIKRLTCNVPGRGHSVLEPTVTPPPGWADFVDADVRSRPARVPASTPAA